MDVFTYNVAPTKFQAMGKRMLSLEVGERHGITSHIVNSRSDGVVLTTLEFKDATHAEGTVYLLKRIGLIKGVATLTDKEISDFLASDLWASAAEDAERLRRKEAHLCVDCEAPLPEKVGKGARPIRCVTCKAKHV